MGGQMKNDRKYYKKKKMNRSRIHARFISDIIFTSLIQKFETLPATPKHESYQFCFISHSGFV